MSADISGENNNEYYKKLNQQIVQKDNLIKLLQLQIRSLQTKLDSPNDTNGSKDIEDLKKALDEKQSEVSKLQGELEEQKSKFAEFEKQKNEQIDSLNKILEDQSSNAEASEKAELDKQKETISGLEQELSTLKEALAQADTELTEAKQNLSAKTAEMEKLSSDFQSMAEQQSQKETARIEEAKNAENTIKELNDTVKKAKSEAEEAKLVCAELSNQIEKIEEERDNLKVELASIQTLSSNNSTEAEKERNALKEELLSLKAIAKNSKKTEEERDELKKELLTLKEASEKSKKIEEERDELKLELAALQTLTANSNNETVSNDLIEAQREIEKLTKEVESKETQISKLQIALEAKSDEILAQSMSKSEEERFTNQIADQLISIQGFQRDIAALQEELAKYSTENARLKEALTSQKDEIRENNALIPVEGENDVISSFIDFFDGLEAIISKNPIPELKALHQKLLDRLITPNEITHMEVISEKFNPKLHVATTYFHSDKFPEQCIVFEEEKGYKKGDAVVKKAKVWVVQNLYSCSNCGTMQSNPDSRFCHLCGAKITAPNGLSIDTLPVYEPDAITYSKFAERMLEKDDQVEARRYILSGLEIDPNYVPLLTRYADILANESNFEKALEMLNKANAIKFDQKTADKIVAIRTKLSIYNQAKALNLNEDEIDKLLKIIQK